MNENYKTYSTDEIADELERESVTMDKMFRNLSDGCREELLKIAIEFYEDKENRRNPYKK